MRIEIEDTGDTLPVRFGGENFPDMLQMLKDLNPSCYRRYVPQGQF